MAQFTSLVDIWDSRPDLKEAFPEGTKLGTPDNIKLNDWWNQYGKKEYPDVALVSPGDPKATPRPVPDRAGSLEGTLPSIESLEDTGADLKLPKGDGRKIGLPDTKPPVDQLLAFSNVLTKTANAAMQSRKAAGLQAAQAGLGIDQFAGNTSPRNFREILRMVSDVANTGVEDAVGQAFKSAERQLEIQQNNLALMIETGAIGRLDDKALDTIGKTLGIPFEQLAAVRDVKKSDELIAQSYKDLIQAGRMSLSDVPEEYVSDVLIGLDITKLPELQGDIETQVIEAEGRRLLINKQTGEIIEDFGRSDLPATGGTVRTKTMQTTEVVGGRKKRITFDQYGNKINEVDLGPTDTSEIPFNLTNLEAGIAGEPEEWVNLAVSDIDSPPQSFVNAAKKTIEEEMQMNATPQGIQDLWKKYSQRIKGNVSGYFEKKKSSGGIIPINVDEAINEALKK